ncbi:MAG TPA: SGNH/GDSL hydrolase family protein [Gemmatimonadaceae bacterium]|nr:SGNH/GDSL hydrolase family protein [Gemmatimonadaceae bacterium]
MRHALIALLRSRANLILLVSSILVGIALFEVAVRLVGIDYNLSPNWKFHPVLGWSQVPNGKYETLLNGKPLRVRFNSLGFRDEEHQLAKPPGVKRIVVIGDSFSEAVQVNVEETFHHLLQGMLNAHGGTRWEVINIGVGDFGTAQEYIALVRYGLAYQPDVVIHEIFPLNDICNNGIELVDLCRSKNDQYRPYFVEKDGDLAQTYSQPVRNWMRHHVVTFNVMEYWLQKLAGFDPQSPKDRWRPLKLLIAGFKSLDPLLYTYVHADAQPKSVADAWRVTDRLIERIADTSKARGAAYIGMVVPFEMVLQPAWAEFQKKMPPPRMDGHYPEDRLASLYGRMHVPYVMLTDYFQPYLSEVLPFIDGHLSQAGHRRAAEALYAQLVAAGIAGK